MILRNEIIQPHGEQCSLCSTFSLDESHAVPFVTASCHHAHVMNSSFVTTSNREGCGTHSLAWSKEVKTIKTKRVGHPPICSRQERRCLQGRGGSQQFHRCDRP